ncbi:MAG: hypothetical protein M0Z54_05305 [Thermaerobacter sp.]|nr:hypothetical protein [Thermaerobacter sp.]
MDIFGFQFAMDTTLPDGTLRWVMLKAPAGGTALALVTWFDRLSGGSLQGTVRSVPDLDAALAALTIARCRSASPYPPRGATG